LERQSPTEIVRAFRDQTDSTRSGTHIDWITANPKTTDEWVTFGIAAFLEAVRARDALQMDATIALEIFLRGRDYPVGVDFSRLEELVTQLSHPPPELIAYRSDGIPDWRDENFTEISETFAIADVGFARVFLQEWLPDDEPATVDRRVWLVSSFDQRAR
jgi:hypothetical protein